MERERERQHMSGRERKREAEKAKETASKRVADGVQSFGLGENGESNSEREWLAW